MSQSFSVQKRIKLWLDGLKPYWKIQVKKTAPLLHTKAPGRGLDDNPLNVQQKADVRQIIHGRARLQTAHHAGVQDILSGSDNSATKKTPGAIRQDGESDEAIDLAQPKSFLLMEGMNVRMHIGRSHVTKESVVQMREHVQMQGKSEEKLPLDPHAAPTLIEVPELHCRSSTSILAPRFVSAAPDAAGTDGARARGQLQRSQSVHFIDTDADDGDEEGQTMAMQHTVVLGMLTLRKSDTEGHTMPSSTARMLICKLRTGEEIEIRDRTDYLGDVVTLRFTRVPPLVQTVAHDLMTGQDVIRQDTYAEFEVVKVNTLAPVKLQHGMPSGRAADGDRGVGDAMLRLGCKVDPNVAQLCLPYQLYARLSGRLVFSWLRGAGWSVITRSYKGWCVSPYLKLKRRCRRYCTGREEIDDLIEGFLDAKLWHVKSSHTTWTSHEETAYERMKSSYAEEDLQMIEVARHIRFANGRKMTKKRASARRKSYAFMQKVGDVQEMQIAVTKYLDGVEDDIGLINSTLSEHHNSHETNTVEKMAARQVDEYLRSKYAGAIRYE
eukprot:COSAG02_NODE_4926_length_4827_cov_2.783418_6_plen_551_part_00